MADILWRDTALTPKIFILNARAVFPLALWLFHWAWWTAGLAFTAIVALYLVQRTGMTPAFAPSAWPAWDGGGKQETRKASGANAAAGKQTR